VTARPSWASAREIARDAAHALATEEVRLADALGRRLATDVTSAQDIPHYASSAMDGWAVAGPGPWRLTGSQHLDDGGATVIATGGVVPAGTTGVLRREFGSVEAGLLRRTADAAEGEPGPGTHVRPAGTEAATGDVLITAGTVINPVHLAVAAAGGHDSVSVVTRPRVALVLTGDEVVDTGLPLPGQVRDSFRYQLPAIIDGLGARVVSTVRARDTLADTVAALGRIGAAHDLVVITGGTGLSDADHVRAALGELGATFLVDSVAMRPGSPSMLARLPDGRLAVALPGNPLAAVMGLLTLIDPLIAGLLGAPPRELMEVRSAQPVRGHPTATLLAPCVLVGGVAETTQWRGSGMLRGLADATAVLVVPPGNRESGSTYALPLPWC